MATFVIVHGGWGGGWEWTPVARQLRQLGHEVFTPTLSGLGERAHSGAGFGLEDHIRDVLGVLEFEQLDDVVLCGHSAGGITVTGVADRVPERVRLLAYLDAFVPRDGEALVDLAPAEFREGLIGPAAADGLDSVTLPPELLPPEGVVAEAVRAAYVARIRPHPIRAMTEPIRLSGAVETLERAYVRCTETEPESDTMAPFAARARSEGWHYRESPTAHDLQMLDPDGTAALLDELAGLVT